MGVWQKWAGRVCEHALLVIRTCVFLLVCVSCFKGQSKHPMPPGRKNRNGTCRLVIAQPCSGFTLGWKRSGNAPCCNLTPSRQASPCRQKSTNSCNMFKRTVTIQGFFFDCMHCSRMRCVSPSCSCCKEGQALGFNPAEGSNNKQPYLFTLTLAQPGKFWTCCVTAC